MSGRIGIAPGFFIELRDGQALNRGLEESQALPTVLFWLRTHRGDNNYDIVQQWAAQKEKQLREEFNEQVLDIKRDYVNAVVDEVVRKSKLSKLSDREMIEEIRTKLFEVHGLPPDPGTQI